MAPQICKVCGRPAKKCVCIEDSDEDIPNHHGDDDWGTPIEEEDATSETPVI